MTQNLKFIYIIDNLKFRTVLGGTSKICRCPRRIVRCCSNSARSRRLSRPPWCREDSCGPTVTSVVSRRLPRYLRRFRRIIMRPSRDHGGPTTSQPYDLAIHQPAEVAVLQRPYDLAEVAMRLRRNLHMVTEAPHVCFLFF